MSAIETPRVRKAPTKGSRRPLLTPKPKAATAGEYPCPTTFRLMLCSWCPSLGDEGETLREWDIPTWDDGRAVVIAAVGETVAKLTADYAEALRAASKGRAPVSSMA